MDIDVSVGLTKNPVHPAPNTSKAATPMIQPFRPELRIFEPSAGQFKPNSACKIVAETFDPESHPVPTSDNTLAWNQNGDGTATLQKKECGKRV
jgi:hypothetical protein